MTKRKTKQVVVFNPIRGKRFYAFPAQFLANEGTWEVELGCSEGFAALGLTENRARRLARDLNTTVKRHLAQARVTTMTGLKKQARRKSLSTGAFAEAARALKAADAVRRAKKRGKS